jgi:hypothetical protein
MALSFRTLFLVFLASCDLTLAHVALTYPPARKYDLDFLDNSRTKGPCGMPKGKTSMHLSLYTQLRYSNMDLGSASLVNKSTSALTIIKVTTIYGTRKFIAAFTRLRHMAPSADN